MLVFKPVTDGYKTRACARRKLRAYQRHITFYSAGIHYVITNGNQYKKQGDL